MSSESGRAEKWLVESWERSSCLVEDEGKEQPRATSHEPCSNWPDMLGMTRRPRFSERVCSCQRARVLTLLLLFASFLFTFAFTCAVAFTFAFTFALPPRRDGQ